MIISTVRNKIGWLLDPSYLLALVGFSLLTVALLWPVTPKAERAERERLCRYAVQKSVEDASSATVERSGFLIKELRCEIVEPSLP